MCCVLWPRLWPDWPNHWRWRVAGVRYVCVVCCGLGFGPTGPTIGGGESPVSGMCVLWPRLWPDWPNHWRWRVAGVRYVCVVCCGLGFGPTGPTIGGGESPVSGMCVLWPRLWPDWPNHWRWRVAGVRYVCVVCCGLGFGPTGPTIGGGESPVSGMCVLWPRLWPDWPNHWRWRVAGVRYVCVVCCGLGFGPTGPTIGGGESPVSGMCVLWPSLWPDWPNHWRWRVAGLRYVCVVCCGLGFGPTGPTIGGGESPVSGMCVLCVVA